MSRAGLLAAGVLLTASHAAAQGSDGFVGTSKSMLASSICTRVAVCTPSGSAVVLGEKRSFFHLKLRRPVPGGLNEYDVYVTTRAGVATSAVLLYPSAQDGYGDGKFRLAFFAAATGVSFAGQPKDIEYSCSMMIRGARTNYMVGDNSISLGYARQQLTVVLDLGKDDGQAFSDIPKSRKVTFSTECR